MNLFRRIHGPLSARPTPRTPLWLRAPRFRQTPLYRRTPSPGGATRLCRAPRPGAPRFRRFCAALCALLALLAALLAASFAAAEGAFTRQGGASSPAPASAVRAAQGEAGSEDEDGPTLQGSAEQILGALDTAALQACLDALSERQRELFGDDAKDKLASLVDGGYAVDYTGALSALAGLLFGDLAALLPVFCAVCSVAILCGILDRFKSSLAGSGTARLIFFVGYAAVLVLILSTLTGIVADCVSAAGSLQAQMQAVFPLLLTLTATSGGSVSAAVYRPAVLFLSDGIVRIVTAVVFPLASLMCVMNMAGHMSGEIRLKNFCNLFAGIIKWLLGLSLAAFTVFLTVQGITSATYDGLSFKAMKFAVGNTVPIVGGFVGGGLDLVAAGSVLIKNSVGLCGVLLMALVLAAPLAQLAAYNLFLRLSAAVTEPMGEGNITGFLSSLAGTVNYFTAGLVCTGFMYFITVLLLICSSGALF